MRCVPNFFITARYFCGNVKLIYIVQVKIFVLRARYTGVPPYPPFTAAQKKKVGKLKQ